MGGMGSGRTSSSPKTTGNLKRIDIRFLRKQGFLKPNRRGSLSYVRNGQSAGSINFRIEPEKRLILIFSYRNRLEGNDWLEGERIIPLTTTPCQFGGVRHWLECPRCARRCEVVYMLDTFFYCRQCCSLLYPSQLEGKHSRACAKRDKLYEKLHGNSRPRMWKRTRDRLYFEYLYANADAINALSVVLEQLNGRSS
jgi:hypothetical protein